MTLTGLMTGQPYTFLVAATNTLGAGAQSASTAELTVGAPTAPTAVTATAGVTSATLKWTAPSSNNGSPVTGYIVTPYLAGVAQASHTFNSTATTATVTGLTTAKTYSFTVAAKNAVGTGPQSIMSNTVTPK